MKKKNLNSYNLKNKKVFVIGGSGLLGTDIVKLLLKSSAVVINLDLLNNKNILLKKNLLKIIIIKNLIFRILKI